MISSIDDDDLPTPLIGRWPQSRPATAVDVVRGGSHSGLSFALNWGDGTADSPRSLTFFLESEPVWNTVGKYVRPDSGVWGGLLEGIANAWIAVRLEETYPASINADSPSKVYARLQHVIENEAVAAVTFDSFRLNHDLSAWVARYLQMPSLWFIREGTMMLIETGKHKLRWSYGDVIQTLTILGDALCTRLNTPGWADARQKWTERENVPDDDLLAISLGIDPDHTARLLGSGIISRPQNRQELMRGLDEVRAAARMLATRVSDSEVAKITNTIRQIGRREVSELDALSNDATALIDMHSAERPHEQGQKLARWVREKIGFATLGSRVDPTELLREWGVEICVVNADPNIEAISAWGENHGPAVILNEIGKHTNAARGLGYGGARSTLAHEICHLLVDRKRALPVAEVFGGSVPNEPEVRARSFAAEFLLPQEFAAHVYRNSPDLGSTVNSLCETYGVTMTVAAFQLLGHFHKDITTLRDDDRAALVRIAGPRRS